MSYNKQYLYKLLDGKLSSYTTKSLPGITNPIAKDCLIRQMVDSIRRIGYVKTINTKPLSPSCTDPSLTSFNPLLAASLHFRNGNQDEAFWLVFLLTHFGKNINTGWNLTRNVYGKLGNSSYWSWNNVCQDIVGFKTWLNTNQTILKSNGKVGNHRKYQSLSAYNKNGTGDAIETYINWVGGNNLHKNLINNAINNIGTNPKDLFNYLYNSMACVRSFGRTAKFDYLTMIGKLGFINIVPNSTYMQGATGPYSGGKRLFGKNESRRTIDSWLIDLEAHIGVYYGMQVLEDSICNWNKNPVRYKYFGG